MSDRPTFRGLVLAETDSRVRSEIREIPVDALPEGDVLVEVAYSSLNYKDGLAVTGKGKIVQRYPMIPGIDLAGTVVESRSPRWKPGERVLATGWGLGERTWGGYARLARLNGEWLVPVPSSLTLEQAMALGTAGFTAMLCILALENHGLTPESAAGHEVVVTGAAGGVGSVAVAVLNKLGYNVTAVSGRPEAHDYLRELGARQIIPRDAIPVAGARPLESQRWAAGVDVVGGPLLVAILRQVAHNGAVAICGLAGGAELNTTVFPFILRGIGLLGVESVMVPAARRRAIWERLARDIPRAALDRIATLAPLSEIPELSEEILKGQIRGRVVVDVTG